MEDRTKPNWLRRWGYPISTEDAPAEEKEMIEQAPRERVEASVDEDLMTVKEFLDSLTPEQQDALLTSITKREGFKI
jgi:hypothetical protein